MKKLIRFPDKTSRLIIHRLRQRLTLRNFRFLLGEILFDLRPGRYCWADVVLWAMKYLPWRQLHQRNAEACRVDTTRPGSQDVCMCGEYEQGVCWSKRPKAERNRIRAVEEARRAAQPVQDELPF